MLYLLTPPATVKWSDLPTAVIDIAIDNNADLAKLDWQASERPFDDNILGSALRHGLPCSTGIVLHPKHVVPFGQGDEIRRLQTELDRTREAIRHSASEALMEHLSPGWTEHGEQLDRQIAAQSAETADRRDAKAAAILAGEIKADLATHWANLGGIVPDGI